LRRLHLRLCPSLYRNVRGLTLVSVIVEHPQKLLEVISN
jgi:hypothetical protein